MRRFIITIITALAACLVTQAQEDTTGIAVDSLPQKADPLPVTPAVDSVIRLHSPRKAAIRSAILPGWGQVYNKKYWKVPIVYAALGISGGIVVYNIQNYRDLRLAYRGKVEAQPSIDPLSGQTIPGDSTNYWKIKPNLLPLDLQAIRTYRDEFRRNVDFSALVFLLFWGLNVVDATVDAHLKTFDVSPDLSLRIVPGISEMAGTAGVSLVLAIK